MEDCLACRLTSGELYLPGGRIYETEHWVVEHCIGPLPVGSLIVKPFRHCLHVWDLSAEEAEELGPLLKRATRAIREIVQPDQVYVCLWSHGDWSPGHIHFVLQPSWDSMRETYSGPGPFIQVDMFREGAPPPRSDVDAFAVKARGMLHR